MVAVLNEPNEAVENKVKEIMVESGNSDLANDVDKIHPIDKVVNRRQKVII